jgi:hypothetical protein
MMNDDSKRAILRRRSIFIAAAMSASTGGVSACAEPQACLDPVPVTECHGPQYGVAASADACVGKIVVLRAAAGDCDGPEDLTGRVIYATSDPAILVIEDNVARGVAPGVVTVTALIDGVPRATTEVTVNACAIPDAAAD